MKQFVMALVILLTLSLISVMSFAETRRISRDASFGCLSRDTYEKLVDLAVQGDNVAFQKLLTAAFLTGECIPFERGQTVYIEDTKLFSGMVKVRPSGEVQGYWTAIEAVAQ
jgi:hypothetical protein